MPSDHTTDIYQPTNKLEYKDSVDIFGVAVDKAKAKAKCVVSPRGKDVSLKGEPIDTPRPIWMFMSPLE